MERYDMCLELSIGGVFRTLPGAPFRFQEFPDTITHVCKEGEMLWQICAQYYTRQLPRPSMWASYIADFQPEPILDPTLGMDGGRVLYVPSPRVIRMYIQDPARQPYFNNW